MTILNRFIAWLVGVWVSWRWPGLSGHVARAFAMHEGFEVIHREQMAARLGKLRVAAVDHRSVQIDEARCFVREHGQYDQDQKLERIENEVVKIYGKKAPRRLIGRLVRQ